MNGRWIMVVILSIASSWAISTADWLYQRHVAIDSIRLPQGMHTVAIKPPFWPKFIGERYAWGHIVLFDGYKTGYSDEQLQWLFPESQIIHARDSIDYKTMLYDGTVKGPPRDQRTW